MPTEARIEERLVAVEHAVAELRQLVVNGSPPANWLDRFGALRTSRLSRKSSNTGGRPNGRPTAKFEP